VLWWDAEDAYYPLYFNGEKTIMVFDRFTTGVHLKNISTGGDVRFTTPSLKTSRDYYLDFKQFIIVKIF
jgi:hypothetical protein